jgi:hypothetical protein
VNLSLPSAHCLSVSHSPSLVGRDFRQAIEVINLNISQEQQIRYIALDFSRMSKKKGHTGGKDAKGAATGKEWSRIESSLGKEVEQNMRRAETGNETSKKVPSSRSGKTGDDENSDTEESQASTRMDVLRELEEISTWSLHETGIFSRYTPPHHPLPLSLILSLSLSLQFTALCVMLVS